MKDKYPIDNLKNINIIIFILCVSILTINITSC